MTKHTEITITIHRCIVRTGPKDSVYVAIVEYPNGYVSVEAHDNDISLAQSVHNGIIQHAGGIRLT
jgi:hypothetical protein